MRIPGKQLDQAVVNGIINAEQAKALQQFLATQHTGPHFDFTHVLYYLGGLLAIGAMTLFMTLGWESFGGWGILAIALIYALVGLKLANLFASKGYQVPAALCAAFVVTLTPLAVYGLQQGLGAWPDDSSYRDYHRWIQWHWLYMELATLAVGAIIAWRYRFPFLIMPVAVTLWYLSMDLSAMLTDGDFDWQLRKLVSMYCGLLMIGLAFWVDIRARHNGDYAFWLYLFGVIAFWGGLSLQQSDSELAKFGYFCINLLLIGVGAVLVRRVFVVFGALGSCGYLGHLAANVFKDSWLFPITLTFIGLLVIYLGILWQKHEQQLTQQLHACLPAALQELLDNRQL
ncbi:hypothetical protein ACFVYJ_03905 [Pontibacter sp. JAM-7]|uniref:hypothetical protein n=1 Tax=Pontibacter sp. JAM-7 TaxID=3366581 RepID=UPI003AF97037